MLSKLIKILKLKVKIDYSSNFIKKQFISENLVKLNDCNKYNGLVVNYLKRKNFKK